MTTMRLFLVRHGETVDNVAGIYAGTRDSPLTAHGVLQARRLGAHLAAIGPVRHIFASDLRRAVETARAVVKAQSSVGKVDAPVSSFSSKVDGDGRPDADPVTDGTRQLRLVQLPELRERDFGSAEGKKFGVDLALAGAESREQMRRRAERFVDGHLVPLFTAERAAAAGGCLVVVAHGLILDSLLRVLLARFGPRETAQPDSMRASWSNTGYVELAVGVGRSPNPSAAVDGPAGARDSVEVSGERTPAPLPQQPQITLSVVGVNVLKHLEGLKKTRGGIGSAQFDKRQRTMDSFFGPATKKARVEREPEEV